MVEGGGPVVALLGGSKGSISCGWVSVSHRWRSGNACMFSKSYGEILEAVLWFCRG